MANTQQYRPGTPIRETWQFHTELINPREMKAYEARMNQMGADGWDLVSAYPLSMKGMVRSPDGNTTDVQVIWKRRMS